MSGCIIIPSVRPRPHTAAMTDRVASIIYQYYLVDTEMNNRKMYNTTLDSDLIRQIKILAAQLEKRQNDLLEEAIQDLLKKYQSKADPY